MRALIASWRREADRTTLTPARWAFLHCASELEQAWHDYAHDATFADDCKICDRERASQ